jgi:hypothetical protein
VRKSRAIEIALVIDEYLRFVDQPPESGGMHDTITVALVLAAIWRYRFLIAPPPTLLFMGGVRCQCAWGVCHFSQ